MKGLWKVKKYSSNFKSYFVKQTARDLVSLQLLETKKYWCIIVCKPARQHNEYWNKLN